MLAELEEETSEEILEEMEHEPKTEVRELLEFDEDTAGGMMNTEYVALDEDSTVADAIAMLQANEELMETLNTLFLIDEHDRLKGVVPVARLFVHEGATPLSTGDRDPDSRPRHRTAGQGDRTVRQVQPADAAGVWTKRASLTGVITADDIITRTEAKVERMWKRFATTSSYSSR